MRAALLLGLRSVGLVFCLGGLLASGEPEPEPAAAGELRIDCDGVATTTLAGQDFMYAGNSTFTWDKLTIRVGGQLHVFCGVGLRRTGNGATKTKFQIQSITANGRVTVTWQDGTTQRELQGERLVIAPGKSGDGGARITLDGTPHAKDKPAPGPLAWNAAKLRWQPAPKAAAKPD